MRLLLFGRYLVMYLTLVGATRLDGQIPDPGTATQWGGSGHWYQAVYVGGDGVSWTDARSAAHGANGYLATATTAEENAFIFSLVQDDKFWMLNYLGVSGLGPWLGGYQNSKAAEPTRNWVWDSGEEWSYTNWAYNEPNNFLSTEDCLQLYGYQTLKSAQWNDLTDVPQSQQPSEKVTGYVVEWNQVPEPSATAILFLTASMLSLKRRRHKNSRSISLEIACRVSQPRSTIRARAAVL